MNPEQWLSLKWNGGSTMSDRWLNQSKIIHSFDGICRCYRSRTDRMVYHGYSIDRTDHKNTEIKSK